MADVPSTQHRAQRRGRTVGVAVYAAILTAFTAVCSVEIILQAWAKPRTSSEAECRASLLQLIASVRRAREAASNVTGGEREAVAGFRSALGPEWSAREGLEARCAGDPEALRSVGDVDRLRFAEEHALRYEALDVAGRRRRVLALEKRLTPTAPEGSGKGSGETR